ncbi:3-hydroxyacyl-CoA dehydrogenase NAD-binding domain-containing protein [Paraburkholderia caribensis]|uniref:3-hydroxyacyl-CoA dehydrogenase NAD-binding domain-containing protein n=1 Tax=Paraburkholderia caribensis TaxID=75105 RepID=UPI001CB599D4|nr:3-hydroxyacyl-CoA dehydrogenase NAD-binding domain-containing protein [Paraburkholderia caribensis]CAG9262405.1 Enoyl-CoA hydratase [Paraburkholderia caribensis]
MTSSLDIRRGIAVVFMDAPPVNALGLPLRTVILERIEAALAHPDVRGIVLTGSTPKAFSAGADIAEFGTPASNTFPSLSDLIARIESAPVPAVAAIGGFALGGGMELALGCHVRVASKDARLGLPEITLGLIPGAGGTQRLPRIVGRDVARTFIALGKPMMAEKAHSLGVVDVLVEGDLVETAVNVLAQWLDDDKRLPAARDREMPTGSGADEAVDRGRKAGYMLPLEAIDRCIAAAGTVPFEEGLALERSQFETLVARHESEALRYAFFAERLTAALDDPSLQKAFARQIDQVAVVGAGTMGTGIAICFADAGFDVRLFDANPASLEKGVAAVGAHYGQQVAKGRITRAEAERRTALISPVGQIDEISSVSLVVEAVFEDLEVKRQVFTQLDAILKPDAILATNTSTLDVNAIARSTRRPESVIGLHFFSPASVMRLLEIVRGDATAPDLVVTALSLAKRLGKVGVVAGVCDGFIGNRMWHQYLRQAARVVELGATPEQVDSALERWGFAMGPFRVADLAGLDVGYLIRQRQQRERPEMRWAAWLDRVSESGRLGQKSGSGIYRYERGVRGGTPDPEVTTLIEASRADAGLVPTAFTDDEIVSHCVHALIVEGTRLLEEKIAQRGSDVDAVFLNGYGFPRYRGGPLLAADALGLRAVVETLESYAKQDDSEFWTPPKLLRELAAHDSKLSAFSHTVSAAAATQKEKVA